MSPGAGTGAQQGTLAFDVNPSGTTAGTYVDAGDGTTALCAPPQDRSPRSTRPGPSTPTRARRRASAPMAASPGSSPTRDGTGHGFVRTRGGAITTIDGPDTPLATVAASINPEGVVGGYYVDPNCVGHGLVWYPDGSFVTFEDPAASTTAPGHPARRRSVSTPPGQPPGFTRTRRAPGTASSEMLAGTLPISVPRTRVPAHFCRRRARSWAHALLRTMPGGEVTGWYIDANGVYHGFVWQP